MAAVCIDGFFLYAKPKSEREPCIVLVYYEGKQKDRSTTVDKKL